MPLEEGRQLSTATDVRPRSAPRRRRGRCRGGRSARCRPRTRCLTSSFVPPARAARARATRAPRASGQARRGRPATGASPAIAGAALGRVAAIAARVTPASAHGAPCLRAAQAARRRSRAWRRAALSSLSAPSIRTSSVTTSRLGQLDDRGARGVGGGVLDDREVAGAERGDLRQVGDAEHLPALAPARAGAAPDGARGVPADARVDLVEHERRRSPGEVAARRS